METTKSTKQPEELVFPVVKVSLDVLLNALTRNVTDSAIVSAQWFESTIKSDLAILNWLDGRYVVENITPPPPNLPLVRITRYQAWVDLHFRKLNAEKNTQLLQDELELIEANRKRQECIDDCVGWLKVKHKDKYDIMVSVGKTKTLAGEEDLISPDKAVKLCLDKDPRHNVKLRQALVREGLMAE